MRRPERHAKNWACILVVGTVILSSFFFTPVGANNESALQTTNDSGHEMAQFDAISTNHGEDYHSEASQVQTSNISNESEPNEDFNSATPIQSGATIRGSLANESDMDIYRIEVASSQTNTLSAVLMQPYASTYTTFAIFAPDGEIIASEREYQGSHIQLSANITQTGVYFIGVWENTGPYLLSTTTNRQVGGAFSEASSNTTPQEVEPNEGFSQAQPIHSGDSIRGNLDDPRDIDLYRLTVLDVGAGQTMSAVLMQPYASTYTTFAIFAPDGEIIASEREYQGSHIQLSANVTRPGTYFIGVWENEGPYRISASTTQQVGGAFPETTTGTEETTVSNGITTRNTSG